MVPCARRRRSVGWPIRITEAGERESSSALVNMRRSSSCSPSNRWLSSIYAASRVNRFMHPRGLRGLHGGRRGEGVAAAGFGGRRSDNSGRIITVGRSTLLWSQSRGLGGRSSGVDDQQGHGDRSVGVVRGGVSG